LDKSAQPFRRTFNLPPPRKKYFFPAEIKRFHAMMNSFHRHGITAAWSA